MSPATNTDPSQKSPVLQTAIDLTIKIGALLLVIFFCFRILQPFVNILLWALIIAIIEYPLFLRMRGMFKDKKKLTALVITILLLTLLLIPSYWLVNSLIDGMKNLVESFNSGTFQIPPPSETVSKWPVIGEWLYDKWLQASENLSSILREFLPQLGGFGERLFSSIAGTGLGILQFAVSIIMAGVFLMWSDNASLSSKNLFHKLVGERGEEFSKISEQTIRNVATGVLGVAIIQTVLIGISLILVDVPFAGVWIVVVMILIIAQLPVLLLTVPFIIYLFAFKEPLPAVLWTIYLVVVGLLDNFLKPLLMGQGSSIPMLVIFLGAIGGFIAYGFLGLFLGAIGLSLGYKLYLAWLDT